MKLPTHLFMAIGVFALAGCTTITPTVLVRAEAREPGRLAAPAKIFVESQAVSHPDPKIVREFADKYGADYRKKLDERYATLLAAGDRWAKQEAAKIEAHARLAPTVIALLTAQGYTVVPKDQAEYMVTYGLTAAPWSDPTVDNQNDVTRPFAFPAEVPSRYKAFLMVQVSRTPYTPEELRHPVWRGTLSADDEAPPEIYLKTLLQYLGRDSRGGVELAAE